MLWSAHSASCLYLETFESFYHMKFVDFEDLYEMMRLKEDPRAGNRAIFIRMIWATINNTGIAGNASKMGAIEGKVKLAICLRILYGENPKSLCQVFRVCRSSVVHAFHLFLDAIGNCDKLDFGVKCPTTQELQVGYLHAHIYMFPADDRESPTVESSRFFSKVYVSVCFPALRGSHWRSFDQNTVPQVRVRSTQFFFRPQDGIRVELASFVRRTMPFRERISVLPRFSERHQRVWCKSLACTLWRVSLSLLRRR